MNSKTLLVVALLASAAFSQTFDEWAAKCGRTYADDADRAYRQGVYEERKAEIDAHNAQNLGYTSSPNCAFGDMTLEEAQGTLKVKPEPAGTNMNVLRAINQSAIPPESVDWRDEGMTSSVKHQSSCGSCWAFTTTAVYESFLMIAGMAEYDLSEEYVLQCTTDYAASGTGGLTGQASSCAGGYVSDALKMLIEFGMPTESAYPYISASYGSVAGSETTVGICDRSDTSTWLKENINGMFYGYNDLDDASLKLYTAYNPLVVLIYADSGFMSYQSGVYSGCPADYATAKAAINHAVQLVGYDVDGNWIVKNSWGTSWGVNGYGTISGTVNCGLSAYVYQINGDNEMLAESTTKFFLLALLLCLALLF